jgi:hypothetical protein
VSKSRTLILTTAITSILAAGALCWLYAEDEIDVPKTAIDQVKIEFRGKAIHLNVFLNHPQTCKQVITELGVETLPVKKKVFTPSCTIVKDDYIKIVFEEQIMV